MRQTCFIPRPFPAASACSCARSNYYFAVDWRHLRGALKQFAEFFVAPLLAPEAAAKEMLAIESEHHKNLQEDAWRLQQLLRTAGLPGTPVSRFSTGNLATLNKTNIDEELLRFHSAQVDAALGRLSEAVEPHTPSRLSFDLQRPR